MAKGNNLVGIVVIILSIAAIFYFFDSTGVQSTVSDIETQLKQEYNTYWGDSTDGGLTTCESLNCQSSNCQEKTLFETKKQEIIDKGSGCVSLGGSVLSSPKTYYEDNKFICEGSTSVSFTDSIKFNTGEGAPKVKCTTKQNFKGQEVVLLISGSGGGSFSTDSLAGGCTYLPTCVRNADSSTTCKQFMTKFIPHTFDTSIYDVVQNGIKVSEINIGNEFKLSVDCSFNGLRTFGFIGSVDYIGSKAEFACDLSGDEVWIQEQFAEPFNINDVEFIPTKFCHETRPFVLRRLDEGEKAIRRQEGIQALNVGETLPASSIDLITVNYAAFFVEGVTRRCAENQANVRDGDGWVCQDVIKPLEVVVQCQQNSDCPQPLKNECPDYFTGCTNSFCTYDSSALNSEICKNELVTIIKDIEKIQERELIVVTGTNIFPFTATYPSSSFNFGIEPFSSSVDFTCEIPKEGTLSYPNPSPSCYKANATFEDKTFDLSDGDVFKIRDNIEVKYFAGGSVKFIEDSPFNTKKSLSASFVFEVIGIPLEIDVQGGSEVLKDSTDTIKFTIKNNLPEGTALVKINEIPKRTNQILPEQRIEKSIEEGSNDLEFDMDTSNLGIHEITLQSFYKLNINNQEVLFPSGKIIFNMNVVNELSGVNPDIVIISSGDDDEITVTDSTTDTEIPTIVWVIGGLVALFLIARSL
jgi:hypothetical protein|tara:strand:- start:4664 stop:6748 length:2085 start_codon:yes stop_codon:yes gene_type:complete